MKYVIEYKNRLGVSGVIKLNIPDVSLPEQEYCKRMSAFALVLSDYNNMISDKDLLIKRRIEK